MSVPLNKKYKYILILNMRYLFKKLIKYKRIINYYFQEMIYFINNIYALFIKNLFINDKDKY